MYTGFTATIIGPGSTDKSIEVNDMRPDGVMVGGMEVRNTGHTLTGSGVLYHAFMSEGDPNGPLHDLGSLNPAWSSRAYGINQVGDVVGICSRDREHHSFLYSSATMTRIGARLGPSVQAFSISDEGLIVGTFSEEGQRFSFIWEDGRTGRLLGGSSAATYINSRRQIVGLLISESRQDPCIWKDPGSEPVRLGGAAGLPGMAMAINNNGVAVGSLMDSDAQHAFIWDGAMRRLSTLGKMGSSALHLNDEGHVVGYLRQGDTHRAALWVDNILHDLNEMTELPSGLVLVAGRRINSRGQIACVGKLGEITQSLLLTPKH